MPDGNVICRTAADLERVYGIKPFTTKKNVVFVHWPVVVIDDGTAILLESFWGHVDGRSPNERPDLIGKRVVVIGTLNREPPTDEYSQNIAIPCISPVVRITPETLD